MLLLLSISIHSDGKTLDVKSILMIACSAKLSLTRQIILVTSFGLDLFWTIVLNPAILKSDSVFIDFVSVSTKKITLNSFVLIMSNSSRSRIISPLLMFQLPMLIPFDGFVF